MHLCFVVNWTNQNTFSFFAPKTRKDAIWKENLIPMNVPTRKASDCTQIEAAFLLHHLFPCWRREAYRTEWKDGVTFLKDLFSV